MRHSCTILIIFFAVTFYSCHDNTRGIVLVTGNAESALHGDIPFSSGEMKLQLINPGKPDQKPKILTGNFYSACSPALSFDGKFMIFSGQINEGDPWQIWEMDLGSLKARQVISSPDDCLFPAYLPGNLIVFSKTIKNDSIRSGISLFRCNKDGSDCERITFSPSSWFASIILSDGRILAKCINNYPEKGPAEYMVLRPDGTKAQLFYERKGVLSGGKALETSDGKILFTETLTEQKSDLISILYNRPFNSMEVVSGELRGDFISVSAGIEGTLVVCYRNSPGETYKSYEYDIEAGPRILLHGSEDYDVLDAVLISERQIPRKLPSEVDMLVKTGQIMCQDVNFKGYLQRTGAGETMKKAMKVGIHGIDSSFGVVETENDGSIYLKVLADTPFRITTLHDEENTVNETSGWMWLRPNERRGCVGCHEDPDFVPGNRIPEAVKKSPVIIPVNIQNIQEKKADLE